MERSGTMAYWIRIRICHIIGGKNKRPTIFEVKREKKKSEELEETEEEKDNGIDFDCGRQGASMSNFKIETSLKYNRSWPHELCSTLSL